MMYASEQTVADPPVNIPDGDYFVFTKRRDVMALEIEKYKERLLEERDQLERDIAGKTELPGTYDDGVQDSGDRSVHELSMDVEGQVMNLKSDRLQQINTALQRIEQGNYGICVRCGKEIPRKRLDADPAALTCLDCLSAEEQNFKAPTM
jgi:DnaK suppressor protein